jgi:pimeloyl-ACP methyl ester carboxylesterase
VSHLVLFNAWTHTDEVHGIPWADGFEKWLEEVTESQGVGSVDDVAALTPSLADDPYFRSWWQQAGRRGASPAAALEQYQAIFSVDLRPALEKVDVPTLVIQRRDALLASAEGSRRLAASVPGARYVELPGADLFPFAGNTDAVVDEV